MKPAQAPGRGRLSIVGSGIQMGRDLTARARSEIESADRVYCTADAFGLAMIRTIRPDTINLSRHYADGKDRRKTYRDMVDELLTAVRSGLKVCAVYYGHPGVFADAPHDAIRQARAEGLDASMQPGVSADACLFADLGLDPGSTGAQCYEATHFLVHHRVLDPAAIVVLWQIGLCGDLTATRYDTTPQRLGMLVDKLLRWYEPDTGIVLYEAAQLPIQQPRIEQLTLGQLPQARFTEITTLVIPPARAPERDSRMVEWLGRS